MKKRNARRRGWMAVTLSLWVICVLTSVPVSPAHAATHLVPESYATIQAAVLAASEGDTVSIAPGVYRGPGNRDIEFGGKDLVVMSREGREQTVIDCEDTGRGFRIHQGESPAARIQGLTIRNGNANAGYGGGITCDVASASILDCKILDCRARSGGGIAFVLSGGRVERCDIVGNSATDAGGGLFAMFTGGHTILDCVVTGNISNRSGGGVSLRSDEGGDIVRRCTIAGNECVDQPGGGFYTNEGILIDRCTIWGNCAVGADQLYNTMGTTNVTCSDVDSTGVGVGFATINFDDNCISADPMFCGPEPCGLTTAGDWKLNESSPCLPANSPCGLLIGALDAGCGTSYPPGACCLPGGACEVVSEYLCGVHQGMYQGNGTPCGPETCEPVPVERTTWGRIKANYREQPRRR